MAQNIENKTISFDFNETELSILLQALDLTDKQISIRGEGKAAKIAVLSLYDKLEKGAIDFSDKKDTDEV